jgi:hypothetical protein
MEKLKAGDWYIWNNNKQICLAEEDHLDILNKHLANNDIQKLPLKKDKMKNITKKDVSIILIAISILLMTTSIACLLFEWVIVTKIISFKTLLLLLPFIFFSAAMIYYEVLCDKDYDL